MVLRRRYDVLPLNDLHPLSSTYDGTNPYNAGSGNILPKIKHLPLNALYDAVIQVSVLAQIVEQTSKLSVIDSKNSPLNM